MAVQFDATGSGNSSADFSFNHTISGTDRYLFVQVENGCTAVTYNGVSMTELSNYHPTFGTFAGNCPYVIVYGLANPDTGTHSVTVTNPSGSNKAAVSTSYTGVSSVTHGADSASVGGQTTQWEGTVTLGTNDWGVMFASMSDNVTGVLQAYTNSTLRINNSGSTDIAIMDTNSTETPGSYSLWTNTNTSSGFFTVTTFSISVAVTTMTKSETIAVFDYVGKIPERLLSETISVIDSMVKIPSRLLNEAISLLDTLDNIKGTWYQVAYTETIALTDSIVNSFVFFITAVENLTITDAVLDFAKKLRGLLRGKNNNTNIKTGVRRT